MAEAGGLTPAAVKDLTVVRQLRSTLLTWPKLLLFFVPVGFATNYAGVNPLVFSPPPSVRLFGSVGCGWMVVGTDCRTVVLVMDFIAVTPLAGLLSNNTKAKLLCSAVIGYLLDVSILLYRTKSRQI